MSNSPRIQSRYDKLSGKYDSMLAAKTWWAKLGCKVIWGFPDTAYSHRVVSAIPEGFCGELLDVPVGTGLFTAETYLKMPDAKITCLDYSQGMLKAAEERFCGAGCTNVTLVQGDVGALPFEDESFDALLSMNGLHAFPDKEAAFAQLHRVLKPGGMFAGCTYVRGETRRTDWFISHFFVPAGWFSPPFMAMGELEARLKSQYGSVNLWNVGSIAGFACIK